MDAAYKLGIFWIPEHVHADGLARLGDGRRAVGGLQERRRCSPRDEHDRADDGLDQDALTDLKTQEEDAWIFWQTKKAEKTAYSYAILFAIEDSTTGRLMFALPMSMEIEVELDYKKVLWMTTKDKVSCSATVHSMKVAQILFPKAPGSEFVRQTVGPAAISAAEGGSVAAEGEITQIRVTNWAKTQTFATASGGSFTHMGGLVQVMAADPIVHQPLEEEMKYLVSFTIDGETKTFGLIFNGTLPDRTLWFVSQ